MSINIENFNFGGITNVMFSHQYLPEDMKVLHAEFNHGNLHVRAMFTPNSNWITVRMYAVNLHGFSFQQFISSEDFMNSKIVYQDSSMVILYV